MRSGIGNNQGIHGRIADFFHFGAFERGNRVWGVGKRQKVRLRMMNEWNDEIRKKGFFPSSSVFPHSPLLFGGRFR
jgi:hypothetical protein